jgi:glycosyltransferase involved in cell wall biosynthesis
MALCDRGDGVNESVFQDHIDPSASRSAFSVPAMRVDLAQSLLAERENQHRPTRIALLIRSIKRSGGNRVISDLFDRLRKTEHTEIRVLVVPYSPPHIEEVSNLISARRRYRAAASVRRIWRPVNPGQFDLLISTSRRTLDFVTDLAHPAHVHLLQAVEAWDTVDSTPFLEYCRDHRYPAPDECIDLVRQIGIPHDVRYLNQIGEVGRIRTVSGYLESAIRHAGRPREVVVCDPGLFVLGAGGRVVREIDFLLFLRGEESNGDALSVAVINGLQDKGYRIMVVAARRAKPFIQRINKRDQVSIVYDPSDAALAELYASTRVVLHPSLCNGGGFIPIEALSFGCAVVASRTGWLISAKSNGNLVVVDRHDPNVYRLEVLRALENPMSHSISRCVSRGTT